MADNVTGGLTLLGALDRQEDIFRTLADAIVDAHRTRQPLLVDHAGLVPLSAPPIQFLERTFVSTPAGLLLHEVALTSAEYRHALDGSHYLMETLGQRQGFIGLLLSGPDGETLYRSLSARDQSRLHRVCDWSSLRSVLGDIYQTFGYVPDERVLGHVQELRMRASAVATLSSHRLQAPPRIRGLLVVGLSLCLGVAGLLGVEGAA